MARTFDVKCLELARAFLSDEPSINDESAARALASDIQDTIETFISWAKDERAAGACAANK